MQPRNPSILLVAVAVLAVLGTTACESCCRVTKPVCEKCKVCPECKECKECPGPPEAQAFYRWVDWLDAEALAAAGGKCPQPEGNVWKDVKRLFHPPLANCEVCADRAKEAYCVYELNDPQRLSPQQASERVRDLLGLRRGGQVRLRLPDADRVGLVALATPMEEARLEVKQKIRSHARDVVGALDSLPAPLKDGPKVRVALLDSIEGKKDHPCGEPPVPPPPGSPPPELPHGQAMCLVIRELACPQGGSGHCAVDVKSYQALKHEGGRGTWYDLAQALHQALEDWQQDPQYPEQRLVINLSLGWEVPPGGKNDSTWVNAIYQKLEEAAHLGALVIASVGNDLEGPTASQTPMYPAAWEEVSSPKPSGAYSPLVHAVDGLDGLRRRLLGAREQATPRLATYSFHLPPNGAYLRFGTVGSFEDIGPVLSGTSVSTAVVTATAAAAWYHDNTLGAHTVMDAVYEVAHGLGQPADFPPRTSPPEVRLVSFCKTLEKVGAAVPPAQCVLPQPGANPHWTNDGIDKAWDATGSDVYKTDLKPKLAYGPYDCGTEADNHLHSVNTPWPPPYPCSAQQIYGSAGSNPPPPPPPPGCDVCALVMDVQNARFIGFIGPKPVKSPQLKLYEESGTTKAVHHIKLGEVTSDDRFSAKKLVNIEIKGLDLGVNPDRWQRAELVGVVEGSYGPVGATDELPIMKYPPPPP